jgi:hypothetical protein
MRQNGGQDFRTADPERRKGLPEKDFVEKSERVIIINHADIDTVRRQI